ncbi:MAG TPA: hypothetical protein VIV40_29360 [Kofleriaceae bacterium]
MKNLTLVIVALLAIGGCKKKGGGGDSAGAALAKMTEFKDEMCKCKDAKCAQDVSDKMSKWTQEQSKNGATPPKLSDNDQKQAAALGEELGKCMQNAMAATPPPPAGSDIAPGSGSAGSATASADGLPAECAEYKAQVEKIKTCEKLPPKAKDALIKAFNEASAGWAGLPEAAKAGLNTSCKRGTEAVVVAAKEACGW